MFKDNDPPDVSLGKAMQVKTEEEACVFLAALVDHIVKVAGHTREKALEIALGNIGYYTGYVDRKTAERVLRLFKTVHPIFGAIEDWPTPERAFEMGVEAGKKWKKDSSSQ